MQDRTHLVDDITGLGGTAVALPDGLEVALAGVLEAGGVDHEVRDDPVESVHVQLGLERSRHGMPQRHRAQSRSREGGRLRAVPS